MFPVGYVMLVGLLGALFAFSGYEAGAHLAEETQNATVSAPWGIIGTCITVAITGFIYIVGACGGDGRGVPAESALNGIVQGGAFLLKIAR